MTTPEPKNRASNPPERRAAGPHSDSLADILERVLDSGVVIAGDIRVQLADIELLTIQLRLIVCSVERAEELGMDWWRDADWLESGDGEAPRSQVGESESAAAPRPSNGEELDPGEPPVGERLDRMEQTLDRLERNLESQNGDS